ncbi:MAG: cyanoexosortase A system-associated protein [Cyanobacteria bacterium P01_A01_bin.84]
MNQKINTLAHNKGDRSRISIWQKYRIPFLVITFTGVFLVLGKVILTPPQDKLNRNKYSLPESVSLPNWEFQGSDILAESIERYGGLIVQRRYQYQQNKLNLDIEMRYMSSGNVKKFIHKYKEISSSTTIRQHKKYGYYGIGMYQNKAYLSGCINPQGGSTFTGKQFSQNKPSRKS